MIGGIIVLSIFLVALVSMMVVSQQYDAYQGTVNQMEQKDIDRYSEQVQPTFPGLAPGSPSSFICGASTCYTYTMTVSNLGIGTQIARIYINSTSGPCTTPSLCVLNAAATASQNAFLNSAQFPAHLNPGEFFHQTELWVGGQLPETCGPGNSLKYGCNTVTIVTARGRVFSFLFPFPPSGLSVGGGEGGGTGIYIGPLVITFNKTLIEYTTHNQLHPQVPIGLNNGYWKIPTGPLIFYVQIQTDVGTPSDVYLTAQSVFEMALFDSPGSVNFFFIIAPISKSFCTTDFSTAVNCYLKDSLGHDVYPTTGGTTNGDPNTLSGYQACSVSPQNYDDAHCGKRYVIPKPTVTGKRGEPVIVAFSANALSGNNAQSIQGSWAQGGGRSVTSFLGLSYVYNTGVVGSEYVYGVTLPFIAMCVVNNPLTDSCSV
jgi:hypothetical protein